MFKLLTNKKTRIKLINPINSIFKSQFSSPAITERLSFLKSEEEMRKYFNLVDWDKKAIEAEVEQEFLKEKKKFSDAKAEYKKFNKAELFRIASEFKQKLNLGGSKDREDYQVPLEVMNHRKEHLKNFELINEFSLESVDILKDKPKNYLLIGGFEDSEDISSVLNLLKEMKGVIVRSNILPDLMGKPALIEVYYETDEEARAAKVKLNNFEYKPGVLLKAVSYLDGNKEGVDDRTVVISGLDKAVRQQQLLEVLSVHGHIMKLEMPINIKEGIIKSHNNTISSDEIFKISEKYFAELENTINLTDANEKAVTKNKLNFYLEQLNKLIKDFKNRLIKEEDQENTNNNSIDNRKAHFNNLLVEIKFFMKKFFPNEAINALIIPELAEIEKSAPTNNTRSNTAELNSYNKILTNLESFLSKYEDKMKKLATPLGKEEIPIDLFEVNELTTKKSNNNTHDDPEKLDRGLIYESADTSNSNNPELANEFSKMNFYSTFHPLEEQIAKLNFIRSLSDEEKELLKLKYDIKLSVNTPKFLEYFINFSRATGLKAIDKYIELSELYMSMSPVEKVYHGKRLLRIMQDKNIDEEDGRRGRRTPEERKIEQNTRDNLLTFLGVRRQKKLKSVYALRTLEREYREKPYTKNMHYELDVVLGEFYNMIHSRKLPNLSMNEFISSFRSKARFVREKTRYIHALVPINLAKKRLFIERIRARMIKYNEILREFLKNYELLPKDHDLRKKFDPEVDKLASLIFGRFQPLDDVDMTVLDDEGDENIGFDVAESVLLKHFKKEITGRNAGKEKTTGNEEVKEASTDKETTPAKDAGKGTTTGKDAGKDTTTTTGKDGNKSKSSKKLETKQTTFSRSEYKYSGKPLEENQIINRLDYIKSARDKIINTVLRIRNNTFYKSRRFERINEMVQKSLQERVDLIFKNEDNPKLHSYYLEKINSLNNSAKYVNYEKFSFEEKQYKLEEIVQDIIQKEIDYSNKINKAKFYFDNLENLLGEKVNKNNLIQAFSVYNVMQNMNAKYNSLKGLKENDNRFHEGSPIFAFFVHVKDIFNQEMRKMESIRNIKMEERKRDHDLSLDELFNKRKELIEDYANKIAAYKKAESIQNEVEEELEEYKLKSRLGMESGNNRDNITSDNQFSLINEIKKKEFEIKQNKIRFGEENEDEYSDVTSLLGNLNKLNKLSNSNANSNNPATPYESLLSKLNSKKSTNKGYAFVTFSTSSEAKRFYLLSLSGFEISKQEVKVEPKFDYNHSHFNPELYHKRAKLDGNLLNKREELIRAEKKLKEFENNFWENMDNNQKLNEFHKARDAFKDQYTDPFKKHDMDNNPFTQEDEDEIGYRVKLAGVEEENAWLYEDDKIEKLRRSRDKRIVKAYTEAQLIKRGILEINTEENSGNTNNSTGNNLIKPIRESFFSKTNDFEPLRGNNTTNSNNSGRRFKSLGTMEFLEKTFGRDGLTPLEYGFEKDRRELTVYSDVKELRERFPKEKFTEDPQVTEDLIQEVNQRFIKLLKDDNPSELENSKEELLDRMSNLTPIGKRLQLIINERSEQLEDEETRQVITMQNFYKRKLEKHSKKKTLIGLVEENQAESIATHQFHFWKNRDKYTRLMKGQFDPPKRPPMENPPQEKYEPGDTSFKAFLSRRKNFLNKPPVTATPITDEKNKTQFDPNMIGLDQINKVKEDIRSELYKSIQEKYNYHVVEKASINQNISNKNGNSNIQSSNSVYDFLNNSRNRDRNFTTKDNTNSIKKNVESQLKKEKLIKIYLEELEKNFANELETLPSFREHFLNLKNNNNQSDNPTTTNNDLSSLLNFSSQFKFDKRREEAALLYSGKITPETFEQTFVKNQKEREERMKAWLPEKEVKEIQRLQFVKMGIDVNCQSTMAKLRAEQPHLFDEEAAKEYIKQVKAEKELQKEIESIEERDEVEYFFDSNSGETLDEHLAAISKTRFTNITVRRDEEGRVVIKKTFKHSYKYDLDEVMNFDLNQERVEMMKKIENMDFNAEIQGNVEYYLKFYQMLSYNNTYLQNYLNTTEEDFEKSIRNVVGKVEDYLNSNYFNSINNNSTSTFDDFKRLIDNLLAMNPITLTNITNSIGKLITSAVYGEDITTLLKELSEFSKDIFNEREVRLFVELMKPVVLAGDTNNSNTNKKFNLKNFDNTSKFVFIQQVLLADTLHNLKHLLKGNEIIYLYGILRLLPEDFPTLTVDEVRLREKLTAELWRDYKHHMLKEFNIVLKKENEIRPGVGLDAAKDMRRIFKKVLQGDSENSNTNTKEEIQKYSEKLKEYYLELSKANTSDYDISTLVSDEELFVDEISEQIAKRIERLKNSKELSKKDLVRRRYNEENLYKKQLEYVHKVGKSFEALAYRDDVQDNPQTLEAVKDALRQNAERKRKLLKEGRPEIDFEFNRMI